MSLRTIQLIDPLTDTVEAEGVQFTDGRVAVKFGPGDSISIVHYTSLDELLAENGHLKFVWADRALAARAIPQILEGLAMNYPHVPREALVSKGSIRDWLFEKAEGWKSARPITRAFDKWFPPEA